MYNYLKPLQLLTYMYIYIRLLDKLDLRSWRFFIRRVKDPRSSIIADHGS